MVTAATIYMSLLGAAGLERVAAASLQRTADLAAALSRVAGVKPAFTAPRFHEAVLLLDRPVAPVLSALARRGIFGGLDLVDRYPELGHALLVCATETKLEADIDTYASALADVMSPSRAAA
jgi:glycine dehydrogenase subunit 1